MPSSTVQRQGAANAFGKYQLVERIGEGGMAEVWTARVTGPAGFQRTVVVKRMLQHISRDPQFASMFLAEARLSAKLSHPNIVQVYELGEVEGEYFLAMEYVAGQDLSTVLRRLSAQRQLAPTGLTAMVVREIARALAYAHRLCDDNGAALRIIHRDVSPSNIMISFDGTIKLLDFGIAKALASAEERTQTGTLKGKFSYMAPEQIEGRRIDHRADLFALGVVLHESLTGRRLFKGANELETIANVRRTEVCAPSALNGSVPPELDAICLKALAREPDDRYQTGEEMAFELERIVHREAWVPERVGAFVRDLFPETTRASAPAANAGTAATVSAKPRHRTVAAGITALLRRRARVTSTVAIVTALSLAGGALVLRHRHKAAKATAVVARRSAAVAPTAKTNSPRAVQAVTTAPSPAPPRGVAPAASAAAPSAHVELDTQPPNALVFLDGETKPRGRSPVSVTLDRSSQRHRVRFVLDGYGVESLPFVADRDVRIETRLTRSRRHAAGSVSTVRPAAAAPRSRSDRPSEEVVDPFR